MGTYILYELVGYCLRKDYFSREAVFAIPSTAVIVSYFGFAVVVAWLGGWICSWGTEKFRQVNDFGAQTRSSSYFAYAWVFLLMVGVQGGLIAWHKPDASVIWMVVFAALSSAVAAGGTWICVGYPGMYRQGIPSANSQAQLESIRYEIEILRTILQALIPFYGLVIVGVLLGFEDLQRLVVPGKLPTLWLALGMSIGLIGFHFTIAATIFRYHMVLVDTIRNRRF